MTAAAKRDPLFDVAKRVVVEADAAVQSASHELAMAGEADNANGLRGCLGVAIDRLEQALKLARAAEVVTDAAQRAARGGAR